MRLAGDQPRGDQHAGIRRIGAGGDRRDHHVSVAQVEGRLALVRLDRHARGLVAGLAEVGGQGLLERGAGVTQQHAVLRALGAGERRLHGGDVQLQRLGVDGRLRRLRIVPQTLRLRVGLDQRHALGGAAGVAQVLQRRYRDREEAAGGAVFGGHVGDGGLVFQRHVGDGVAVELDELAHHALAAKHLGDGEHEVGGRGALGHGAGEAEAHHLGDQHGDGLAQHGRLRLDAAHAPAQHGQAVDHGGVAVGAHHRVGVGERRAVLVLAPHRLRQVLEVDLVDDAGAGRHHAEAVKRRGAPAQEAIAFAVALVLPVLVQLFRVGRAEVVDHHRVVDHQVDGVERVDLGGVGAEVVHGVAHGREIDHRGHAGEVLHYHPGGAEGDLVLHAAAVLGKGRHRADVLRLDGRPLVAQQVLQQHLHRHGQARHAGEPAFLRGLEAVIGVGPVAHREFAAGVEAIDRGHDPLLQQAAPRRGSRGRARGGGSHRDPPGAADRPHGWAVCSAARRAVPCEKRSQRTLAPLVEGRAG